VGREQGSSLYKIYFQAMRSNTAPSVFTTLGMSHYELLKKLCSVVTLAA